MQTNANLVKLNKMFATNGNGIFSVQLLWNSLLQNRITIELQVHQIVDTQAGQWTQKRSVCRKICLFFNEARLTHTTQSRYLCICSVTLVLSHLYNPSVILPITGGILGPHIDIDLARGTFSSGRSRRTDRPNQRPRLLRQLPDLRRTFT